MGCTYRNSDHWLGEKAIEKPNGENILFNELGDSIFINTNSSEPWSLYKFPDNTFIEATVLTNTIESILNISDSVKTIQLIRKTLIGDIIQSPENYMQFKISKNYGFVSFFLQSTSLIRCKNLN